MKLLTRKSSRQLSGRSSILLALCVGLLSLLFISISGVAQNPGGPGGRGPGGPGGPRKAKNLQVLDTTISHDELIAMMNKFTQAIGDGCDHCHAQRKGGDDLDFASDDNKMKLVARDMLRMVNNINSQFISKIPSTEGEPDVKVECVTCHRGQPRPILLQDLLKRTLKEHGVVAVDSVYRNLRQDYYGSHTYDFSEHVLAQLGLEVSKDDGKNALTILKLNKEFNPQSSFNEWAMGRVYAQMGDTATALSQFKHALEIDPNNRRAARELEMLGAGKK